MVGRDRSPRGKRGEFSAEDGNNGFTVTTPGWVAEATLRGRPGVSVARGVCRLNSRDLHAKMGIYGMRDPNLGVVPTWDVVAGFRQRARAQENEITGHG